jgi:hypothetical protein
MSKKQEIMEKLFAEKPLSNEEILLIGASLPEDGVVSKAGTKTRKKKSSLPAFNHSESNLSKACGLSETDFDNVNKLIRTEVMDRKDELDCNSKQIEVYERIALAKPQNFRLLVYQFVKMKNELQKNSSGIRIGGIGGLGGGKGGGLDDFLDFLRGQGH